MDDELRGYLIAVVALLSIAVGLYVTRLIYSGVFSVRFAFVSLLVAAVVGRVVWWAVGPHGA